MSKISTFNSLSLAMGALCLTSLAGIQDSAAADAQTQAANLLQNNFIWSSATNAFPQSSGGKTYTSQEQAQRILQPVTDVVTGNAEGKLMASGSLEPQLQADQILNRNINCSTSAC